MRVYVARAAVVLSCGLLMFMFKAVHLRNVVMLAPRNIVNALCCSLSCALGKEWTLMLLGVPH